MAASTTADGRGGGMVVDGEIHEVVVDGAVVVVVSSGPEVVVGLGRVVVGALGAVDDEVGTGAGSTAPGGAVSPGVVVVDSGGRASP
jgi:hypothetical protein